MKGVVSDGCRVHTAAELSMAMRPASRSVHSFDFWESLGGKWQRGVFCLDPTYLGYATDVTVTCPCESLQAVVYCRVTRLRLHPELLGVTRAVSKVQHTAHLATYYAQVFPVHASPERFYFKTVATK